MSTIGNRFMVSTIQDGTTIHGYLYADKTLTQAWNGSGAEPDWQTDTSSQPTIHLQLTNGGVQKEPKAGYTWYYNGDEIVFGQDGYSTAPASVVGTFYASRENKGTEGSPIWMPTLKIVRNLASSSNKDIDIIELRGAVEIEGNSIDFNSSIQVRITEMSANSYVGVLEFYQGKAIIEQQTDQVKVLATLYGGNSAGAVDTYFVKWYVNGQATLQRVVDTAAEHSITLLGSDVVDYATIKAEFYLNRTGTSPDYSYSDLKYTEVVGVDDIQDPEFMQIAANGPTSMRVGDSVTILIWVRNKNVEIDTTWDSFKVQLLDKERNVIKTALPNIKPADEDGWRVIDVYGDGDPNAHKAHIPFSYTVVSENSGNIQGLVVAEQSQS